MGELEEEMVAEGARGKGGRRAAKITEYSFSPNWATRTLNKSYLLPKLK